METFSRMLPLTTSRFPLGLRKELLANSPLLYEEDLSASYIQRDSRSYNHSPVRAALAITKNLRLVVMNGNQKKIDIFLEDPQWFNALDIWSDKKDRINFKVNLGVCGTGTIGSSLEIKVKTNSAARIVSIADSAKASKAIAANQFRMNVEQTPVALTTSTYQQYPTVHGSFSTTRPNPDHIALPHRVDVPSRKPVPSSRAQENY